MVCEGFYTPRDPPGIPVAGLLIGVSVCPVRERADDRIGDTEAWRPTLVPRRLRMRARLVSLAVAMTCAACGGGGGSTGDAATSTTSTTSTTTTNASACTRRVVSGAPEGVVTGANYDGDAGTGGGDSGGGDAGGAGGAEGQFRNALVRVEQADGVVVGEAAVDDTHGMVRFVLCDYSGPVLFTVQGKADGSTTYYDESRDAPLRFPAGEVIRAVVPQHERNVGITPLTEAAYQYVVARYGPDGWRNAAQVREANETVRREVNRLLPATLQVEDITRLPVIVGSATGTATGRKLPATANGLYGTVVSGIAIAAGLYKTDSVLPALEISRQFGLDLSDGRLDHFRCPAGTTGDPTNCNAVPVLSGGDNAAALATYSVSQLAEITNSGTSLAAARQGTSDVASAALRFTQVKMMMPVRAPVPYRAYDEFTPMFLLRSDGNVYLWLTRGDPPVRFATGFRQLYAEADVLGSTYDGRVFANPSITFPPIPGPATVSTTLIERPSHFGTTKIGAFAESLRTGSGSILRKQDGFAYYGGTGAATGLGNVLDVAILHNVGRPGYLAVLATGEVAVWSADPRITGQALGLGGAASAQGPTTPTTHPALREIVAVSGFETGAFAIDRHGRVWGWGSGRQTAGADGPVPVAVAALATHGPIAQIHCGTILQCIALTRAGEVIAWGAADFSAPVYPPTRVALPAGRRAIYLGAADHFGYGMLDDGRLFVALDGTRPPQILDLPALPVAD